VMSSLACQLQRAVHSALPARIASVSAYCGPSDGELLSGQRAQRFRQLDAHLEIIV
jgi:hypothetical protein